MPPLRPRETQRTQSDKTRAYLSPRNRGAGPYYSYTRYCYTRIISDSPLPPGTIGNTFSV